MLIPNNYKISTPRLILRIPVIEDIPFIYSATKYQGFNDGMLWDPPGKPEDLLEPHKKSLKLWELGEEFNFSIENRTDRSLVGRITIKKEKEEKVWSVGYWTHPEHQNQGYMSEVIKAIIQFGFIQLKAGKIRACHALWNKASEKVLKKSGMKFLEYIEKGFKKKGVWTEENLLEIKREDWMEQDS